MYRKRNKGWLKHLDFAFLDLLCMQLCLAAAYYGRHRELNRLYRILFIRMSCVITCRIRMLVSVFVDGYQDILKHDLL